MTWIYPFWETWMGNDSQAMQSTTFFVVYPF